MVGGLAAKGSAPSLEGRGCSAVPVGWEREGAALPCGIRRGGGTGGRVWLTPRRREGATGTSAEDVCMDGQSGFCPRPPGVGFFFSPWGYN